MSRTTAILLLLLGTRIAVPWSAKAQKVDTLFYFDPDSLEECAYIGDVLDLAVHFQIPAEWQSFGIRKLGLLNTGSQDAHSAWLYICAFSDYDAPGDVIDSILVNFQYDSTTSPSWKMIDLSRISSLQDLSGDFWVRGPALFTGLCDISIPSGHGLWYSISLSQWAHGSDVPLYAVVQDQSDSLAWLEYFPHHIGDKWLYRVTSFGTWPLPSQEEYELVEIVGDTVMGNGYRYLHFSGYLIGYPDSRFFRIDTAQNRIYEYSEYSDTAYCPTREVLLFDFSLELPYDSIWGYNYQNCQSYYLGDYRIWRESGSALIGIDTLSAPYYLFGWFSGIEQRFIYSEGFGLTRWHLSEITGFDGYLIAAEINGIHYGEPFAIQSQLDLPADYHLGAPYPNPFNPATTIRFELPHTAQVTLTIYDLLGREVATLVEGYTQPGTHEAVWDAGNHPSGIYLARLATPGYSQTIKLVLLK